MVSASRVSHSGKPRTDELLARFAASTTHVRALVADYLDREKRGGVAALDSIANNVAINVAVNPDGRRDLPTLDTASELQTDRWKQRNAMRRVLRGTRPASCGRILRGSDNVRLWWDSEMGARYSNLQTCGSVWVCPVCNHKIQVTRCDEVRTMLEHCKEHDWTVVFATHTVRHNRKQSLRQVEDMASTVWRKVSQHRRVRDMKARVHLLGYVRASESTWSIVNGWHWHYHTYWIFTDPLEGRTVQVPVYKRRRDHTTYVDHFIERDAFDDFRDTFTSDWVDTAVKQGYKAPRFANQVFETIDFSKESTVQAAARYCTAYKTATTPQTSRLGHELTDTQSKIGKVKRHANGRDVLHLTYWDFVRILSMSSDLAERTLSANGLTLDQVETLAREYYRSTKGRKALVWSRGLRDMCGLGEELSDEEVAARDCRKPGSYRLTILRSRVNARKDHVMAGLLAVCNATHGDVTSCGQFLRLYGVAYRVEPLEKIRCLFDEDEARPSPVAILLKPQAK